MNVQSDQLTVLMPARNAASTIERAIRSTLRSLPDDSRFLVLDDASDDGTGEIVRRLSREDKRLDVISASSPNGVAGALNILLDHADSGLIARMDADDITLPWRFSSQLRALSKNHLDLVFTPSIMFGGRIPIRPQPPVGIGPDATPLELLVTCTLLHPTMLGRRSVVLGAGGYRRVPAEDWDLFMRLAQSGVRLGRISKPGLLYRIHPHQVTQGKSWHSRDVEPETAAVHEELSKSLLGWSGGAYAALCGSTATPDQLASAFRLLDDVWERAKSLRPRDALAVRTNIIGIRRQVNARYLTS